MSQLPPIQLDNELDVDESPVEGMGQCNLRNCPVQTPLNVKSVWWQNFGVYPKVVLNKENVVVCKLCRHKYAADESVEPQKWEINYGVSKSTGKLKQHLMNHHRHDYNVIERA